MSSSRFHLNYLDPLPMDVATHPAGTEPDIYETLNIIVKFFSMLSQLN